jgi:ABC-2 type transport system permease protein
MMVLLLGSVLRGGQAELTLLVASDNQELESIVASDTLQYLEPRGLAIALVNLNEGYRLLDKGDAEAMLVLMADTDPLLALEGTNPQVTDNMKRFARQMLLTMDSRAQGRLPPNAQPHNLKVVFMRAGPELDIVDSLAPAFISFFGYLFVFLLTTVAFLRERQNGTLERLLTTPIRQSEIVAGYMIGLGIFALAQALVIVTVTITVLQIHLFGNPIWIFFTVSLLTLGAVNLGVLCSTFARNEFQVVQFIPMVVIPQALLSGAFFQLSGMPDWIVWLSKLMPLTYAVGVVRAVMIGGSGIEDLVVWQGMIVLLGFALLFFLAGATALRRKPS